MKNITIINYSPLNFNKSITWLFMRVLIVFILGWVIFYILSNESTKKYIYNNFYIAGFIFFGIIAITLIQTWLNDVYIYNVVQNEKMLTIKWQELKHFKELTIPINIITVKLKPSGKNTPYLELTIKNNDVNQVLKQTYYPGWNKKTMNEFINKINQIMHSY